MKQQKQHLESLPATGYIRESAVLRYIPWGRSTLWAKAKSGDFPKPIKLSARVTAWRAEDVRAWIESRAKGLVPSATLGGRS